MLLASCAKCQHRWIVGDAMHRSLCRAPRSLTPKLFSQPKKCREQQDKPSQERLQTKVRKYGWAKFYLKCSAWSSANIAVWALCLVKLAKTFRQKSLRVHGFCLAAGWQVQHLRPEKVASSNGCLDRFHRTFWNKKEDNEIWWNLHLKLSLWLPRFSWPPFLVAPKNATHFWIVWSHQDLVHRFPKTLLQRE